MRIQVVLDAVLRWEFAVGLVAGGLGVAAGVAVRRWGPPPWGLLLAVPAGVGMLWLGRLSAVAAVGIAALAVSGHSRLFRMPAAALVLVGAGLVAWAAPRAPAWLPLVVFIAVVGAGFAVRAFAAGSPHRRALPLLVVLTAGGVFVTVPDTQQALVVLGAALPVAVAATVGRWPLGQGGAFALAGVVVWAVAAGGAPRPGSVVGALTCFGVLLAEPLWRRVVRQPETAGGPWAVVVLVTGHAAAVFVAGRVAGMRTGAVEALPWALVALAVAAATVICVTWLSGRAGRATLAQSPPSGGPRSRGAA